MKKARAKAFSMLARRDYTRLEMEQKLEKTFDSDTARAVADDLCREGYIDDDKIARMRVESYSRAHKSQKDMAIRLRQSGIERDMIEVYVEEADERASIEHLLKTRYAKRLQAGENQKVFMSLQRKGFRVSNIKSVMGLFFDDDL